MIYLRGKIITLIDMRSYLNIGSSPVSPESQVILADSTELSVGFRVDRALDTMQVLLGALDQSQDRLEQIKVGYGLGITPDHTIVLDLKKMIADPKLIVNQTI